MVQVPRANIIRNVVAISTDTKEYGSALAYPVKDSYYFITAAHLLKNKLHAKKTDLHIFQNDQWHNITATPYFASGRKYSKDDLDLAFIKTDIPADLNTPKITLSSGNLIIGQDVYFLGFPYFASIKYKSQAINSERPIPFMKKAILAAFEPPIFYLDGHNNPGFSGGPVIFWDYDEKQHKVLGIISGYLNQKGEIKHIETSTKLFYEENSGIAMAYNITSIVDQIESI
jgi:hypothetical protein